jgi:hypothetical protein
MSLLDYDTLRQLLLDYAAHTKRGDVVLRDSTGDHEPQQLLQQLASRDLEARIVRIEGDGGETSITTRTKSWLGGVERRFSIYWSADRQGWAFPNGFGHSIHYFVPKHYLNNPPFCGDAVFVSLCKRSFIETSFMFRPPDPKYSVCKVCQQRFDELQR